MYTPTTIQAHICALCIYVHAQILNVHISYLIYAYICFLNYVLNVFQAELAIDM